MLEDLLKNDSIRNFIQNYSTDKWESIIKILIQLGIEHLNLKYKHIKFDEPNLESILSKILLNVKFINFRTKYYNYSKSSKSI